MMLPSHWAKSRSFSKQYASQLIRDGVIQLVDGKVDPDAADAALAAKRSPAKALKRKGKTPAVAVSLNTQLLKARTKTERARGRQLEHENRVAAGKYVDRDDVRQDAFRVGREIRDGLLNIPDRMASVLAAESDAMKIHSLLTAEIAGALKGLADAA